MEAVGKADPNNVVEEIGRGSEIEAKQAKKEKSTKRAETIDVNYSSIADVLQFVEESEGTIGAQPTPSSKKGRRRG